MIWIMLPEGLGTWLWCIPDVDQSQQWHTASSLEQLIQDTKSVYLGQEACVFFPTQQAQFFEQSLSRQQYKQLGKQGTAYLIEDMTIDPVDYLAVFDYFAHDRVYLMAMPQALLATYQQSLALLPWNVRALLPDFLLFPEPKAQQLILGQIGDRKRVRWSTWRGWTWEQDELIELLMQSADQPIREIIGYGVEQASIQTVVDQVLAHSTQNTDVVFTLQGDRTEGIPWVPVSFRHPFNVLRTSVQRQRLSGYWIACGLILTAAVAMQALYDGLRWWKYQKLSDQTAQLVINQYKQWFPDDGRITEQNVKRHFKAKLQANTPADRQALELISRVGAVMQQANLIAQQIDYQADTLNVRLLAKDAQAINQVAEQFKQQGLSVTIGTIEPQAAGVVGQLQIQ